MLVIISIHGVRSIKFSTDKFQSKFHKIPVFV